MFRISAPHILAYEKIGFAPEGFQIGCFLYGPHGGREDIHQELDASSGESGCFFHAEKFLKTHRYCGLERIGIINPDLTAAGDSEFFRSKIAHGKACGDGNKSFQYHPVIQFAEIVQFFHPGHIRSQPIFQS